MSVCDGFRWMADVVPDSTRVLLAWLSLHWFLFFLFFFFMVGGFCGGPMLSVDELGVTLSVPICPLRGLDGNSLKSNGAIG